MIAFTKKPFKMLMLSESAVLLLGTNPKGAGEIGWGVGNRSLGHNKFIIAKKKKEKK